MIDRLRNGGFRRSLEILRGGFAKLKEKNVKFKKKKKKK